MSHTTLSNNLFNKLFNEAILSLYTVTQYPLQSTDTECINVACRPVESNLAVESVASVDMYCKLISNVERYRTEKRGITFWGMLRSCALVHTQIKPADNLRSCTQNQIF